MITAAERELAGAGIEDGPGVVLADAGYWSNELHRIRFASAGCLRSSPLDTTTKPTTQDEARRPIRLHAQGDRQREPGASSTHKRQCMVEPVFAQIKTNRRIERFKRRGRAARAGNGA